MVLQMRKGILDFEKAEVIFPTTLTKVQTEMRGLEEFGKSYGVVRIVSGEGPAQFLNGCVQDDDLNTETGIQRFNRMAEVIDLLAFPAVSIPLRAFLQSLFLLPLYLSISVSPYIYPLM